MARTTGPLMSMDASGTIGKSITFASWKGRSYVRRRVIPANPMSPGQVATRSMMRFLAQAWKTIATVNQATWQQTAASLKISPFNAYIRANMAWFTQLTAPAQMDPPAQASTPQNPNSLSAVGGVRQITVGLGSPVNADIWGAMIFADLAVITPTRTQTRFVAPAVDNQVNYYLLTDMPPGSYHVSGLFFNTDQEMGAIFAELSGIIVT
jgi:hypothetical protein